MATRKETDFLGEVEVPAEAYYGIFTVRAGDTFKLSGMKANIGFIRAVIIIKKAAALANTELRTLDPGLGTAIVQAAEEALAGKFDNEFIIDAFQAGAGTPTHMNVNEVLANRANEILGGKKGEYEPVHPNNHVNMSQSSNNIVPSAIRIAAEGLCKKLIEEMEGLEREWDKKAKKYSKAMKCGRTHLMDAVPMTYWQSFAAYANAIKSDKKTIEQSLEKIRELSVGGTAIGTGITAHPKFRGAVVKYINEITMAGYTCAENPVEKTQSMNDFLLLSGALRLYACTLNRMANDLRLLGSGPNAGIAELALPPVEPGSSIMPGKVNPSVPEAVNMVCWQVCGNDHAIGLAAQSGQLELNCGTPLIAHSLLQSIELLTNASRMFREKCISGMEVNEKRANELLEKSFAQATALNPYLGYSLVSRLVAESQKKGKPLRELILEKGIMDKKDLEKVLSVTGPAEMDKAIVARIKPAKD